MQILVTKQAKKDLEKIPKKIYQRISEDIFLLAENPFPLNSKKLHSEDSFYRMRIGDYRVVYQLNVKERIIIVTKVKHRIDCILSL